MPIKVKIGDANQSKEVTLELNIRKSLNGDFMIFDHGDVDIILSQKSNKVIVFPKDTMSDISYGAQNRLFAHLKRKGIIVPESIQAGSFYGSMEATMQEGARPEIVPAKYALINISSFIEEERPYFERVEAITTQDQGRLVEPSKKDSTELGEVPHEVEKGNIRNSFLRDPYYYSYMYTM
tara:strand:+ start:175 stop:714 length:540 start_codon:yes stop_codon:yes gene_type:complete